MAVRAYKREGEGGGDGAPPARHKEGNGKKEKVKGEARNSLFCYGKVNS